MSSAGETSHGQAPPIRLLFESGTLIIEGPAADADPNLPGVKFDPRTRQFRAEAIWYRSIVEHLRQHKQPYKDAARAYEPIRVAAPGHQGSVSRTRWRGSKAWWQTGGRGVVVLPTGTGKTHLANMAIEKAGRPTLIITPTIDLMNQWYDELSLSFGVEVGSARRRLLRHPAADRHDLRLGLSQHGPPGQPVWVHRLRRMPSPARPDLRPRPPSAPSPRSAWA